MNTFKIRGGARIGLVNATWPFATLQTDKNKLELNATIIGNFVFRPQDVISIIPYSSFLSRGLKINHGVSDYKNEVIFWTFSDPVSLISQIKQTGFLENINQTITENDQAILEQQKSGSNPIKRSTLIIVIVLWNILLLSDFVTHFYSEQKGMPLGIGTIIALGMLLFSSLLLLISKDFRRLLLKEGRTVKDIAGLLYLSIFISIFMLIIILTLRSKA